MYDRIRPAAGRAKPEADVVCLFVGTKRLPASCDGLHESGADALRAALKRPDLDLAAGSVHALCPPSGPRLFVIGLGDAQRFVAQNLRIATSALVAKLHAAKIKRVAIYAGAAEGKQLDADSVGRAVGDGLSIGAFQFDDFRGSVTKPSKQAAQPATLDVLIDSPMRAGLKHALTVGESVTMARTLAATPANVANPGYLVKHCRAMARKVGLNCTIIDVKKAEQLNMGGLLSVGRAGSTPPALICLEYTPGTGGASKSKSSRGGKGKSSSGSRQSPVMLVGKAVTFDTGGYSLKPGAGMVDMKYDKCGGMAVIGAMHAIARLKPSVPVVGLIPAAENMVDQIGYRPGDIITHTNGVTCEVTNTDAEGRLILADALAYGCKRYKPRGVIDLATLTGGVVTALGPYCAGCFCGDTDFRTHLFDAAEDTGERLWNLPLWDEHRAQMKGTHSDIVNSAGRHAHPIQGAAYLSYFVAPDGDFSKNDAHNQLPWAHLDIAGVADTKDARPPYTKGPTGFGVRLLVRAVETMKR